MNLSVFGLGYVGTVTSACLADSGAMVVGVDVATSKVDTINSGRSPVLEPGVDELIHDAVAAKRLTATTDPEAAVRATDLSIVCVGTPSQPTGAIDLQYVRQVCAQVFAAAVAKDAPHTLVIRSTVTPGSVRRLAAEFVSSSGEGAGCDVLFVPEFLREGTALADFRNPSTFVVGTIDGAPPANQSIPSLFASIPPVVTTWEEAEAVKYAFNAFHAAKVAFANEIGRLGRSLGFDSRVVMKAVADDTTLNISPYYLKPGNPYGGSCLPKDVAALDNLAKRHGIDLPLMSSLAESNRLHQELLAQQVLMHRRRKVCILGLSFKQNTDDLRNSPMVALAELLLGKGYDLSIVDPHLQPTKLVGSNRSAALTALPHLETLLASDERAAIAESEVIVAALRTVPLEVLAETLTSDHILIDVNGWPELEGLNCRYQGFCWG